MGQRSRVGGMFSLGWDGFVAAFLYYVILTAAVLGGADFSIGVMAVTYLLPVSVLLGLVMMVGLRAIGRLRSVEVAALQPNRAAAEGGPAPATA